MMPTVAGDSKIPTWVLARVTSSRDRKGLSKSIGEKVIFWLIWGVLIFLSNFSLLAEQGIVSYFSNNSWRILWLLLWFFQLYVVISPDFRARAWLDAQNKWSEISEMEWFESKQNIRRENVLTILALSGPFILFGLYLWFSGPPK
jgi:hypothetical protein